MYHVRLKQIDSLVCGQKEPGFFTHGNSIPQATLVYVEAGSVHFVTRGTDTLLSSGDIALCPPEQWYMTYADRDCAPTILSITLSVEGQGFAFLASAPSSACAALLQRLLEECRIPDAHSGEMCKLLLDMLLLQLDREQLLQSPQALRGEEEIIDRAQQVISRHARQRLSVPLAAQKTGVSPSYLTALFLKHLRIGPGEYIRRIKLQESKNMIRDGKYSFTEIAAALEYSTVHHFSRQFKENFGITPTQYAKSVQNLQENN